MTEQQALRKALGPLGCQLRAALWCAVSDLNEIATRMDPVAWAAIYVQAALVIAQVSSR